MNTENLPNFIECSDVIEANKIDLTIYRFERYSSSKDCYIFVKRRGV
jgi:hypothetical protein